MYVLHPRFAREPEHYVRAAMLIQKDLQELFEYVEPSDVNCNCYSYRIHALHIRTCIEVEANCKAILTENGYARAGDWNMGDYRRLEATHLLSGYEISLPIWRGTRGVRQPFAAWAAGAGLPWYQAYNAAKHDRHDQFPRANFHNLMEAVSGLIAILSAQFHTWDFSSAGSALGGIGGPPSGWDSAIGGYFHVRFPTTWPAAERYDFNWSTLENEADPFQTLTF
jgi:hypothetical protein